jgi:hypothetical protein
MIERPRIVSVLQKWVRPTAAGAVVCLLAATLLGCSSGGGKAAKADSTPAANTPDSDRYRVTADTTSFFLYGPQQANGADDTLKKDTEVTMVKRGSGYSRVTTPDGKTGYVATEDLGKLSAQEIAEENAAQQQAVQADALRRMGGTGGTGVPGGTYTIPPEAGNDERLPVADTSPTPKPTPTPPFRF